MKLIAFICLLSVSGGVLAAGGDQTLSIGYIQVKSNGLKQLQQSSRHGSTQAASAAGQKIAATPSISDDGYSDPEGLYIRYRYELNDTFGLMGAVAYAQYDGSTKSTATNAVTHRGYSNKYRVTGDYVSLMAGPTWRVNDYLSLFGLTGISWQRHADERYEAFTTGSSVTDAENNNVSSEKTALAWSAGIQINAWKNLALEAACESSAASGEWKTRGLSLGLGYRF